MSRSDSEEEGAEVLDELGGYLVSVCLTTDGARPLQRLVESVKWRHNGCQNCCAFSSQAVSLLQSKQFWHMCKRQGAAQHIPGSQMMECNAAATWPVDCTSLAHAALPKEMSSSAFFDCLLILAFLVFLARSA